MTTMPTPQAVHPAKPPANPPSHGVAMVTAPATTWTHSVSCGAAMARAQRATNATTAPKITDQIMDTFVMNNELTAKKTPSTTFTQSGQARHG